MVRLLSFQLSNFCFWSNCRSSRVWLSWPNSKKNFLSQLISRIYRTWTPNISTKFSTKVACKFLTNQRPSTEQTRECTSSTIIRIRTTTKISVPFIWRKGLSTISHKIRSKISAPDHRFLEPVMWSLRILTFQQVQLPRARERLRIWLEMNTELEEAMLMTSTTRWSWTKWVCQVAWIKTTSQRRPIKISMVMMFSTKLNHLVWEWTNQISRSRIRMLLS